MSTLEEYLSAKLEGLHGESDVYEREPGGQLGGRKGLLCQNDGLSSEPWNPSKSRRGGIVSTIPAHTASWKAGGKIIQKLMGQLHKSKESSDTRG